MLKISTLLQLIILSSISFSENIVFGQFNTKQLTTDISEQMIDLDLNHDGDLDIISIGYDSIDGQPNHLYYFENNSGTFLNPVSIGETSQERNIELKKADLDNDGFSDLVYFDKTLGKANLYRNNISGGLSEPIQIVSQFPQMDGIELVDLDSDGMIDIIASSLLTDEIVWFKNLGMSGFGSAEVIATLSPANNTIRITTTDYDSDGYEDLFYISQVTQQLMMARNLGNGTFDSPTVLDVFFFLNNTFTPILNSFDINQDGTDDLVLNMLNTDDNILWYEITSGVVSPQHQLSPNGIGALYNPFFTHSKDLNGDGFNELILADWNDVLYFPNNNGTLSSTPEQLIANLPSYILNISIEDFNGDNYPDIVVNDAYSGIRSYVNDSTFGFNMVQTLSPELESPIFITSTDLDSDGLIDIAFVKDKSKKLYWMKNLGNNNFGATQEFFTVPAIPLFFASDVRVKKFLIADLDNDGINDLVTLKGSSSSGYLEYFGGTGNLNFGASVGLSQSDGFSGLDISDFKIVDLDHDNDIDILYCSYFDDQIGYYENLGSGNYSVAQVIDNCDQPSAVAATDIDNDLDLDVITVSVGIAENKLQTYANTGNNSFASPVVISNQLLSIGYQICTEDADGDSLTDILLAAQSPSKVSWFKNTGSGSFAGETAITSALNSPIIQPLDYDNDGDPDILCRSNYYALETRGVYLLENMGNGNFLSTGPKIVSVVPISFTCNDFDTDGDLDFVSCSDNRLLYSENDLNNKTTARGKIFYDLNNNGILDTDEAGMTAIGIGTNPEMNYLFTDPQGNYQVNFYDTSLTHTIYIQSLPNWDLTTDSATYTLSVNSLFTTVDSLNFGFYPTVVADSISTDLIGGFPRCNDTINYWLNVRNHGSSLPSGIISLNLDTNLTYISATPIPDSISNGNLYWNYENLFYFDDTLINIHVGTPGFMLQGEEFVSTTEVLVLDYSTNIVYAVHDTLHQTLVCAYDPNDKSSEPSGIGYPGYVGNLNEIEYLIRFQNTGNDTAQVIVIKDQLDPLLDWSSVRPICGSHDFTTSVDATGLLTFTFAAINLPDSNTNELASHGFVSYRIKANNNLPVGSVIQNHAEIYFDLNPPVLTNYKILTLFDCQTLFDGAPESDYVLCLSDSVEFGIDYPVTLYYWENIIPSSADNGSYVTLHAENTGINTFLIHAENSICNLDSIVDFTVPEILVVPEGQIQICQGDSALIYNEYQTIGGLYSNILQSQYGCDSIVVKELVVNTIPIVDFGYNLSDTLCISDAVMVFNNSSPSGGTYSGTGITGNGFDPNLAGEGTFTLYYQYVDLNLCSSTDSITMIVDGCLGIKEPTSDVMIVYPNPSDGKVFIEFMQPFSGQVIIYDISGKVCYVQTYSKNQKSEVNIPGQTGVYFLETQSTDNLKSVYKLIKY